MDHSKSPNQGLSMKDNGKMVNLMELENFFFKMAHISMELFQMDLYMGKGGSFQQLDHIMKGKSDIM